MPQWLAKEIGDAIGKRKQFDSLVYPMSIVKIYVIISHTKIIVVECNKFKYTFAMEGLGVSLEFICFYNL